MTSGKGREPPNVSPKLSLTDSIAFSFIVFIKISGISDNFKS